MRHLPKRRCPRLAHYDYAQAGAYFITVVTSRRACILGNPDEPGRLTESGAMVEACWHWLPSRFASISLDCHVVMPNHIHGIIVLSDKPGRAGDAIPEIMRVFKSKTVAEYSRGARERGWPKYEDRLWQRSYYDHVIRNERSLRRLREYIVNNPLAWALDRENPPSFPDF